MSITIYFVGTSTFYYHYGSSKVTSVKDYCEDTWSLIIENGSGNYEATFDAYSQSQVEIPGYELCGWCSTRDRMDDADEWLADNWWDYYDADVISILDYNENDNDSKWGVAQQKAGTYRDRCTMVDLQETENANDQWRNEETEGVAMHELLHMFLDDYYTWEHYPSIDSYGYASLMWNPGRIDGYCDKNAEAEVVDKRICPCTRSEVRNFIDNNM